MIIWTENLNQALISWSSPYKKHHGLLLGLLHWYRDNERYHVVFSSSPPSVGHLLNFFPFFAMREGGHRHQGSDDRCRDGPVVRVRNPRLVACRQVQLWDVPLASVLCSKFGMHLKCWCAFCILACYVPMFCSIIVYNVC